MLRKNIYFDQTTPSSNAFLLAAWSVISIAILGGTSLLLQKTQYPGQALPSSNKTSLTSVFNNAASQDISEQQSAIVVAKNSMPAVVSIVASQNVSSATLCREAQGFPPEFQKYLDIQNQCSQGSTVQQDVGAGSGFIVSSDGYILTNKHVVQDVSARYNVILNDPAHYGQKFPAKVMARSQNNDIAIVKIDAADLPHLTFGDSKSLQVGQTVMVIGYALGEFDSSVSKGIISGLSRTISASGNSNSSSDVERLHGLIQTDAAINPGDSGGPLLDLDGNVVGMNVAMAEGQNIGFAIPSDIVKTSYDQLRSSGKITGIEHAFLGVRYTPVSTEIQSAKKLPYNYGALVVQGDNGEPAVQPGSPAEKAGIVENDIILQADGKQINSLNTLSNSVDLHKPGDTMSLVIYRAGKETTLSVKLGSVTQ
jgi:serine protease Do